MSRRRCSRWSWGSSRRSWPTAAGGWPRSAGRLAADRSGWPAKRDKKLEKGTSMLFLCIAKSDEKTEAGVPPDPELMATMGQFVEEMTKSGVLLATDGLHPSSKAARVRVADGKLTVTDG